MATITRNLKLRLSDNLTADARYNLEKIDQIGAIFQLDSSQSAVVRSQEGVSIRPNDPSIGGSGTGGIVTVGSLSQPIDYMEINGPIKVLANNNTNYLTVRSSNTSNQTLTINTGAANFLLNLPITDAEVASAAAIAGSKVSPVFGNQLVSTEQGLRLDGPTDSAALVGPGANDVVGADVTFRIPATDGNPNAVLVTDGNGNLSFSDLVGTGTVTSVDMTVPNIFTISGNPVTTAGTLALALATQEVNLVFAGPASGDAAAPAFRQLSSDELTAGSTNKFYSSTLFNNDLATKTTTNLAEGTNLYHTALRAQDAVGAIVADTATAEMDYVSGTTISVTVRPDGFINSSGGLTEALGILRVDPTQATVKSGAVGADVLLIADSADSNALKKITLSDIVTLGGNGYSDTWTFGATKAVVHNLNSRNVLVEVYDNTTYETVLLDSVVRTDVNTITLTASAAPSGAGLTVLVKRVI